MSPWEGSVATGAAGTRLGELRRCCGEDSMAWLQSQGSLDEPIPPGRL